MSASPRSFQFPRIRARLPGLALPGLALLGLALVGVSALPATASQPPWWLRKSLEPATAPGASNAIQRVGRGANVRLVTAIGEALGVGPAHRPQGLASREALRLGNELMTSGQQQAAAGAWLAALDSESDSAAAAAWANLGSLLRHEGQLQLAMKALDEAVRAEPWNGLAWFNIALCREGRDDLVGADAAYLKALEVAPHLWNPNLNPLIIGNDRATRALHRRYLRSLGSQGVTIDEGPAAAAGSAP